MHGVGGDVVESDNGSVEVIMHRPAQSRRHRVKVLFLCQTHRAEQERVLMDGTKGTILTGISMSKLSKQGVNEAFAYSLVRIIIFTIIIIIIILLTSAPWSAAETVVRKPDLEWRCS